ncbi:MAG: ATP-binding protein [Pseudomonadota bacterium]
MASPDKPDRDNQREARISWEEPERQSAWSLPFFDRFRGSRIARRIILYNVSSLVFLMFALVALTQTEFRDLEERKLKLSTVTGLVASHLLEASNIQEDTGFELHVFSEDEVISLETQPVVPEPKSRVLNAINYLTSFGRVGVRVDPRMELDRVLASIPAMSGPYPKTVLVPYEGKKTTVLFDRRDIGTGPYAGATLVTSTQLGRIDADAQVRRAGVINAFLAAVVITVSLSIILAYSLATPIHELAEAAEASRRIGAGPKAVERIKIPNLSGRPDEIGRLSLAMRDMTKTLYEQIEHNQRFAADVTHEIKNPLASISSAVQGLTAAGDANRRSKLQGVLLDDVNRIDRLITDISQASKLDADLVRAERYSFDLGKLLEQIIGFHRLEADERGITLTFKEPDPKLFYIGVEQRLAQVFSNLISNAVSICDSGDEITVWNFNTKDTVFVMVEDTGPGVPEENLENIFERFYSSRADNSFGKNSGLGLAISRQIVEGHDGQIWAENIYQDEDATSQRLGARFVVSLPRV